IAVPIVAANSATAMVGGTLPSFIGDANPMPAALGLFILGTAIWSVLLWLVASLRFAASNRA
ncbi:MAG: hypothetical protein AAFY31_13845, partial [Pseudomonadota bacterium]